MYIDVQSLGHVQPLGHLLEWVKVICNIPLVIFQRTPNLSQPLPHSRLSLRPLQHPFCTFAAWNSSFSTWTNFPDNRFRSLPVCRRTSLKFEKTHRRRTMEGREGAACSHCRSIEPKTRPYAGSHPKRFRIPHRTPRCPPEIEPYVEHAFSVIRSVGTISLPFARGQPDSLARYRNDQQCSL